MNHKHVLFFSVMSDYRACLPRAISSLTASSIGWDEFVSPEKICCWKGGLMLKKIGPLSQGSLVDDLPTPFWKAKRTIRRPTSGRVVSSVNKTVTHETHFYQKNCTYLNFFRELFYRTGTTHIRVI